MRMSDASGGSSFCKHQFGSPVSAEAHPAQEYGRQNRMCQRFSGREYVPVAWHTMSASPSLRRATSPTAKRLPSFNSRHSATKPCLRLAQEVERQVGGDGERDRADIGQDGDIEREIRQRHHGGTGQRAAGADVPFMKIHAQAREERANLLDMIEAPVIVHLR